MKVGDKYQTYNSGVLVILRYINAKNILVKFLDTGYSTKVEKCQIKRGTLRDPYKPSIFGLGFIGRGEYKVKDSGKHTKVYRCWYNMFMRCYNENVHKNRPTYKRCTVSEDWYCFQTFAKWYEACISKLNPDENYELDKDILSRGNNVYSPEKCCLVPSKINNLLTHNKTTESETPTGVSYNNLSGKYTSAIRIKGVKIHLGTYDTDTAACNSYIEAKTESIKELALEVYEEKKITYATYQALLEFKMDGDVYTCVE